VKVAKTAIDGCHAAQAFWKKTPNGQSADSGVFIQHGLTDDPNHGQATDEDEGHQTQVPPRESSQDKKSLFH
jgi:hypothetical protein